MFQRNIRIEKKLENYFKADIGMDIFEEIPLQVTIKSGKAIIINQFEQNNSWGKTQQK